ncbi:MAG: MlaD family protein [Pirellulales bacterium]
MSGSEEPESPSSEQFPMANVGGAVSSQASSKRLMSGLWWLTAACLLVAIAVVAFSVGAKGPEITVRFKLGHGIKPGDELRHRGIMIGEVTKVRLDEAAKGVGILIELEPDAADVAVEGSEFWIERPRLSLARVSGLETVVGAKFIGVRPGPPEAAAVMEFQGRETPLSIMDSETVDVTIQFSRGYGLQVGDPVKFREIDAGEIIGIDLLENLDSVDVQVRLAGNGAKLARVGSQFWVERPRIDVSEVRGLDTLVGGRYIAAVPGPITADQLTSFRGLERAPAGELPGGGLEIVLEEQHRSGLNRGVPVLYRGLPIGHVVSVGLAADAATLEARAFVQPAYKNLIRRETRFWAKSGFDVTVGFTGVRLDADSLASIALGGVEIATPEPPGDPVTTGHRFVVHAEPEDEWLQWQPRIAIGSRHLPEGLSLPEPLRATLRWQVSNFGFGRERERQGWVLPLEDQSLLGPADLLSVVDDATGDTVLDVAGESLAVTKESSKRHGAIGRLKLRDPDFHPNRTWPLDRIRVPREPEDCLLVTAAADEEIALAAARFSIDDLGWRVDPSLSLDPTNQGSYVVAMSDGSIVGILVFRDGPHVAFIRTGH